MSESHFNTIVLNEQESKMTIYSIPFVVGITRYRQHCNTCLHALTKRIQFGQKIAEHCNVQGVPQLIIEKDERLHIVPSQLLYQDCSQLLRLISSNWD